MKILLSWLEEFVALPGDVRQVANDLTMLGLAVDTVGTEDGETVLELDITTNRPDCLSHYGVARELAALYKKPLPAFVEGDNASSATPPGAARDSVVEITATDLCRRYSARIIRGVKVGPSPAWLSRRLELVGVRSINNIADATNYILMAYGHPLHAFDMDRLEGGRIVVRRAAEGERFITLDGVERKLGFDDLVIADAAHAVALAGVMGGRESEISSDTRNVLLESAWFEPAAVRRTSKRQGMHTEASHRFERGADIGATLAAAERCIALIRELAGGDVDPRAIDSYPRPEPRRPIALLRSEVGRHLGMEPPAEEAAGILSRLGFAPLAIGDQGWNCAAPTHRVDVTRQIDLVEEVARHYGYDKFSERLPGSAVGVVARRVPYAEKESRVRERCLALGYDETISSVLVGQEAAAFGEFSPVAISNPLSEEAANLRTSLLPGLLSALQWNLNRGGDTIRLFEIGHIYARDGGAFAQSKQLAVVATGDREDPAVNRPGRLFEFLDIKGDMEQLAGLFATECEFETAALPENYRPGHAARVLIGGKAVARFGELQPREAAKWKFRRPVFLAEVFLETLYALPLRAPRVQPLSRFPAVERDFSMLLPADVSFHAVSRALGSLGIAEIAGIAPVEVFRGGEQSVMQVPAGKCSMLLRVTLQSLEGTLSEDDLARHSSRIIECLEKQLGARIRKS